MLRCFAAVEVASPAVMRALEGAQLELRRAFGQPDPVKWVPSHQFHVTLKFLGEIAEDDARRASGALRRAAAQQGVFAAEARGLGAFPAPERPSVLWGGIGEGAARLCDLAAAAEDELAREGFARERKRFHPHVTLGRVREGARVPAAAAELLAKMNGSFGGWQVKHIRLMKSELTPRGPIYSVYESLPLREENT